MAVVKEKYKPKKVRIFFDSGIFTISSIDPIFERF